MRRQGLFALLLLGIGTSVLCAQDKKPGDKPQPPATQPPSGQAASAEEEAWAKAATPGEHHAHLKVFEGSWTYTCKMWMDPTAPPMDGSGTCVRKFILGGRYLQEEYNGTGMGEQPFSGLGYMGYDNVLQKYVGTWMDNMCTGIMTVVGTCDGAGKTFTMTGTSSNPMTGKEEKSRHILKVVDPNTHTFEMFGNGPDGKEMKMFEMTCKRK